jgi:membrane protein
MISKTVNFIKKDVWRIPARKLSKSHSFFIRTLRVVLLSFSEFDRDKCQLRASALTFFTLLSIVPVVAMAFGIAKGFGLEKLLEAQLMQNIQGQEEVLRQIITFAQTMLENTHGGIIAGIGVALLFWTIIKVLGNIEESFNSIWGVKKPRSLIRKFTDYLSLMMICPILMILASGLTVFVTSQVMLVTQKIAFLGVASPLIFALLKLLPYCVLWGVFTFIYIFMPNTKVSFTSGLLGGIVAGTLYQMVQWLYIKFQIGVSSYGAIYGSFAALPLFLVWLQMSWTIVLYGAEVAFAHQNEETYEFEPDCLGISSSYKKLLTLRITHLLIKNFCKGERPFTAALIARELEIPIRLVRQILFELVNAGLISETRQENGKEGCYQPARDVEAFSVESVLEALEHQGTDAVPVADSKELQKLAECLKDFRSILEKSPSNVLLKNI